MIEGSTVLDKNTVIDYFRYPLLTTLIFMPFTFLPMVTAKALWIALNCIAMIIAVSLLVYSFRPKTDISIIVGTVLFGVINLFSVYGILTASLKSIVFLIISLTIYLLLNHHDKVAGIIFTLALIEFQMSIFLAVYFLLWAAINKRKSFIRNFWVVLLFQFIISLILLPSWPVGWLRSLIEDISQTGLYSSFISQFIGSVIPQGVWLNLGIHLGLLLAMIILWLSYRKREGPPFIWVAALTILITSVIVFPAAPGLIILNLPALILVLFTWQSRWEKIGKLFFWIVLALLLLIPWILAVMQNQTIISGIEVTLAFIYPFIGFIGLWWIRWWILKPDLSSTSIP